MSTFYRKSIFLGAVFYSCKISASKAKFHAIIYASKVKSHAHNFRQNTYVFVKKK